MEPVSDKVIIRREPHNHVPSHLIEAKLNLTTMSSEAMLKEGRTTSPHQNQNKMFKGWVRVTLL